MKSTGQTYFRLITELMKRIEQKIEHLFWCCLLYVQLKKKVTFWWRTTVWGLDFQQAPSWLVWMVAIDTMNQTDLDQSLLTYVSQEMITGLTSFYCRRKLVIFSGWCHTHFFHISYTVNSYTSECNASTVV